MIADRFRAMGTDVEAWTAGVDGTSGLTDLFESVESVCSRFRPESELSRLNSSPNAEWRPSPILANVLDAAERARRLTGGLVDIGVGQPVRAWGYDRTFPEVRDLECEPQTTVSGRWDFADGKLSRAGGIRLDLGGIAKGWTCDTAVERGLAEVVSAGGDIRSRHPGTRVPVSGGETGVDVVVDLGVGALATSSIVRRAWHVGNRRVSHIIDPRTMKPVETPVISATVISDAAADAEAGAKAVLILGVDGLAWAGEQEWIRGAIAFWEDGSVFATADVELAA